MWYMEWGNGMVWHGAMEEWCVMILRKVVWYCMEEWCGMVWYGGAMWYGMEVCKNYLVWYGGIHGLDSQVSRIRYWLKVL